MNAVPAKSPQKASRAVLLFGVAVILLAVLWWLVYYSQWQGLFGGLGVKFPCLTADSSDCSAIQGSIGPSTIPVYSTALMWAGLAVSFIGLYLTRRNRAA